MHKVVSEEDIEAEFALKEGEPERQMESLSPLPNNTEVVCGTHTASLSYAAVYIFCSLAPTTTGLFFLMRSSPSFL